MVLGTRSPIVGGGDNRLVFSVGKHRQAFWRTSLAWDWGGLELPLWSAGGGWLHSRHPPQLRVLPNLLAVGALLKSPVAAKPVVVWKSLASAGLFRRASHSPHGLEEAGVAPGAEHSPGGRAGPLWLGAEQLFHGIKMRDVCLEDTNGAKLRELHQ